MHGRCHFVSRVADELWRLHNWQRSLLVAAEAVVSTRPYRARVSDAPASLDAISLTSGATAVVVSTASRRSRSAVMLSSESSLSRGEQCSRFTLTPAASRRREVDCGSFSLKRKASLLERLGGVGRQKALRCASVQVSFKRCGLIRGRRKGDERCRAAWHLENGFEFLGGQVAVPQDLSRQTRADRFA